MVDYTSQLRPEMAPVFAITTSKVVAHQLILNWGTYPIVQPLQEPQEEAVRELEKHLLKKSLLQKGNHLIVMSDVIQNEEQVDSIELRKL